MSKFKTAREVLLRIFWKKGSLDDVKIEIIHRGSPGDSKTIEGNDIVKIGRHWLVLKTSEIPYHRVLRIFYRNFLVFSRIKDEEVYDLDMLLDELL